MHQQCLDLLHGSDIQFHRHSRLDIALCLNLPIALVFLPAADIPRFVGEGRVGLGITGRDQVAEAQSDVEELLDLGFGRCKLQVQVPENGTLTDPAQLVGLNICTSFIGLTREYFERLERQQQQQEQQQEHGDKKGQSLDVEEIKGGSRSGSFTGRLRTKIKYVGGSVEASCALGVADGIVDLVGALPSSTVLFLPPPRMLTPPV